MKQIKIIINTNKVILINDCLLKETSDTIFDINNSNLKKEDVCPSEACILVFSFMACFKVASLILLNQVREKVVQTSCHSVISSMQCNAYYASIT